MFSLLLIDRPLCFTHSTEHLLFQQVFLDPEGLQTRTASTSELYDLCLVQNDLLKAISEPGYFTRRIQICMENYEGNIQKG